MNFVFAFVPNIVTPSQAKVGVGIGIALIVLAIVLFIVGFSRTALENKNKREIERPSIEVIPSGFNLMVNNNGAFAKFEANIKVIKDYMNYHTNALVMGYWQKSKSYRTEIMKNNFDALIIASLETSPAPTNPPIMFLCLYHYDFDSNRMLLWQSGMWSWTPKEQPQVLKPEYELEVTITSNPALPEGFTKHYKLDLEGLHEISCP